MILKDKSGDEKIREAIMLQKGLDKRLYRYTKPESQAGIATLSLPGDIMWLYMPAFGKPKKISLLAKTGAFNNTDFSYEDMDPRTYSERFEATLIESNAKQHILELVPRSDKSSYSKVMAAIDKATSSPVNLQYYDKRGEKIKVATYDYEKAGNYWFARVVTMTDLKKQHSTTIEITDIEFDLGLSDDEFTVEALAPDENWE
jgi:outer membrane lipoprotein-sorting protein